MNLAEKFFQFSAEQSGEPINLNGNVLFIDGLNLYIRMFSATPTMDENGQHVGGITGFIKGLAATVRHFKPSRVVICFDGRGGSLRRRKLYPAYKAHRRNMTRLNRTYEFETLEEEKESMKWQLLSLIALLSHLPVTVMAPDYVEADDVIAYLAQHVVEQGGKAIIYSTDKDFLQLIGPNISVYNPVKKKKYDCDGVVLDYGFHPTNFLLYRMVTGDGSDGITGIEGIKEKTLLKHFPELASADVLTLDAMIDKAELIKTDRGAKCPKVILTMLDNYDVLQRNYELMRLDEVAMSGNTRVAILDAFDKSPCEMNKYEFKKYANNLKITGTFGAFDMWFQSSWAPLTRFKLSK